MDGLDCIVVGAGVVGLAVARRLAVDGRSTLVLERHDAFGRETSSRNSEVIHAGMHYPSGSLKASLCVRGREAMYDYCARRGVEHQRCGKLIVATRNEQRTDLEGILQAAKRNGVTDLQWLERSDVLQLEPDLRCVAALWSPSTGIIDSHALMLALLGDAEAHGAMLVLRTPVTGLRADGRVVQVRAGDGTGSELAATWVINCAGLDAPELAKQIKGFPPGKVPRAYLAKGNYFVLDGRPPFTRLIYPVPEPGGLGIHLTLDLAGRARFGPDVEWVEQIDYRVDPSRADRFYAAIRTYWPGLADGALAPGYSGIRPKIAGPGEPAVDFRIEGPATHGVPGIVNLFGIESPGLTAALAIADHVAGIVAADHP